MISAAEQTRELKYNEPEQHRICQFVIHISHKPGQELVPGPGKINQLNPVSKMKSCPWGGWAQTTVSLNFFLWWLDSDSSPLTAVLFLILNLESMWGTNAGCVKAKACLYLLHLLAQFFFIFIFQNIPRSTQACLCNSNWFSFHVSEWAA